MTIYGYPGMEVEHAAAQLEARTYLGKLADTYAAIDGPEYTLHADPKALSATLSGPAEGRPDLAELFGSKGLTIELQPKENANDPQRFVAHFTGTAYGRLQTAKQAFEAAQTQQRGV